MTCRAAWRVTRALAGMRVPMRGPAGADQQRVAAADGDVFRLQAAVEVSSSQLIA